MLDPRSKCLTSEQKARLKAILLEKNSGVWERRKARRREAKNAKAEIQREQEWV